MPQQLISYLLEAGLWRENCKKQNYFRLPDLKELKLARQRNSKKKKNRKQKKSASLNTAKERTSSMPCTLFSVPKPFTGKFDLIQKNAILSWFHMDPRPEIILMGSDRGVAEMAREIGVKHIPEVEKNEYGTPLVNDIFRIAESSASNEVLVYVNADIILTDDFLPALSCVRNSFDRFLMIGRRWDMRVDQPLDFSKQSWSQILKKQVSADGNLHSVNGIDYFAFTRGLWQDIPPFALGRTAWDNWLVYDPLSRKTPVVDATQSVVIVHQDHDYSHVQGGKDEAWHGPEAKNNQQMIHAQVMSGVTSSADYELINGRPTLRPQDRESRADLIARIQDIFSSGWKLMDNNELEKAIDRFDQALSLCDGFTITKVYLAKAIALIRLGRISEARTALEMELTVNPGHEKTLSILNKINATAPRAAVM